MTRLIQNQRERLTRRSTVHEPARAIKPPNVITRISHSGNAVDAAALSATHPAAVEFRLLNAEPAGHTVLPFKAQVYGLPK